MDFPKVDPEVCTGCGACVDICPIEAIELKNDIAVINTNECTNCRVCESECPVEAIS
jgi:ferredoxin